MVPAKRSAAERFKSFNVAFSWRNRSSAALSAPLVSASPRDEIATSRRSTAASSLSKARSTRDALAMVEVDNDLPPKLEHAWYNSDETLIPFDD